MGICYYEIHSELPDPSLSNTKFETLVQLRATVRRKDYLVH